MLQIIIVGTWPKAACVTATVGRHDRYMTKQRKTQGDNALQPGW